jgi:hypothetical protein
LPSIAAAKAGDVWFIPAGTIHAAKNVGSGNTARHVSHQVYRRKREAAPRIGQVSAKVAHAQQRLACALVDGNPFVFLIWSFDELD